MERDIRVEASDGRRIPAGGENFEPEIEADEACEAFAFSAEEGVPTRRI